MLIAELKCDFPWGLLVIADDSAAEQIPSWATPEEPVTSSTDTIVMRVQHESEGRVDVRAWRGADDGSGVQVFSGSIQVGSGLLVVSDALKHNRLTLPVVVGDHRLDLFADSTVEATRVNVVIDPGDASWS